MKKAIIFDPYLDTLGGGERYTLTFARVLEENGFLVDVIWPDKKILQKAEGRFRLHLKKVRVISPSGIVNGFGIKKIIFFRNYDLSFWVSDGSIPLLLAKKNILHFQVPFHGLKGHSLVNRLKFKFIDKIVCNSFFTKKVIEKEYGVKSVVVYPPVSVDDFSPGKKKNIILAVGRFEETMQSKRQDILIDVFKKMVNNSGLKKWRLVLAGASLSEEDDNAFLRKLKKQARGYPVDFRVNIPFSELKELYGEAKIFWHAAGYGINEEEHPEKVEHFGMTTIEAMAAGCWPLVYNAGGQREIFSQFGKKNLILWSTKKELMRKTLRIIGFLSKKALQSSELLELAQKFSVVSFTKNVEKII